MLPTLEKSTQYRNWLFFENTEKLDKIHANRTKKYLVHYQKILNGNPSSDVETFDKEDEVAIMNFYIWQIIDLCKEGFPPKVEAAAITFFKRFFLHKTMFIDGDDPANFVRPCIYIACKVEEINTDVEKVAKTLKDTKFEKFDSIELRILKTINFELKVYHPFTPLESLLIKLKEQLPETQQKNYQAIRTESYELIRKCFFEDFIFLYPHTYLALGCFMVVCEKKGIECDMVVPAEILPKPEVLGAIKAIFTRESKYVDKDKALKAKQKMKKLVVKPASHGPYLAHSSSKDFKKPADKERHEKPPEK